MLLGCRPEATATPAPATAAAALPTVAAPAATPLLSTATATLHPSLTATASPSPTVTAASTATPTVTATPDPYAGLTIADLTGRSYGGGELAVVETLGVTATFTRTLISYSSDGYTVGGFMDVPTGDGPFPVALVLHGYVDPERYTTLSYTTRYADALARAGYIAIHPDYRNHPPAASGKPDADNAPKFRVDYAIDVLNLIALVQVQAGGDGPLARASGGPVHLLGHSMGGGIALRVLTISENVAAAVLYGAMSGDEYQNYERIQVWSNGEEGEAELATAPEDMARIAPINFLDRIEAAVAIHHGEADATVPLAWSVDLCERLRALEKEVACYYYEGQPHTFTGLGDQQFIQRVIDFFNRY
jgi:dienelactone hydrolase